jgi:hypothetical protein
LPVQAEEPTSDGIPIRPLETSHATINPWNVGVHWLMLPFAIKIEKRNHRRSLLSAKSGLDCCAFVMFDINTFNQESNAVKFTNEVH